jgi:hypothetical protein
MGARKHESSCGPPVRKLGPCLSTAVLETNPQLIAIWIREAEVAIFVRKQELATNSDGAADRQELAKASQLVGTLLIEQTLPARGGTSTRVTSPR